MALRPSWEGFLKLNLLSVPVNAYAATTTSRGRIGFNQIHTGCGSRIRHKKVCPIHGEVGTDEISSGYEYAKGQYVLVDPDDLAKLRGEDEKAITIETFVPPDALDPVFHSGRTYYLTPSGKVGEKPYAVLRHVMKEQGVVAVAQIFISGRMQMALVRPVQNLLVLTLLAYDEQVKKPATFQDEVTDVKLPPKEVELAEMLVKASTSDDFDFAQYRDQYEADLAKYIEAKAKGKKVTADRSEADEPAIINLMEALKRSIDERKGHKKVRRAQHAPVRRRKSG